MNASTPSTQNPTCIRMLQGNLRHCRDAMETLNQHPMTDKTDMTDFVNKKLNATLKPELSNRNLPR